MLLKGKRSERDEHESRTDRLREYIETNKEKLKTYERQKVELESEVKNADVLISQANNDLEQVNIYIFPRKKNIFFAFDLLFFGFVSHPGFQKKSGKREP